MSRPVRQRLRWARALLQAECFLQQQRRVPEEARAVVGCDSTYSARYPGAAEPPWKCSSFLLPHHQRKQKLRFERFAQRPRSPACPGHRRQWHPRRRPRRALGRTMLLLPRTPSCWHEHAPVRRHTEPCTRVRDVLRDVCADADPRRAQEEGELFALVAEAPKPLASTRSRLAELLPCDHGSAQSRCIRTRAKNWRPRACRAQVSLQRLARIFAARECPARV
mmetsp:Transcript_14736/g.39468  ORF Transcript_14736/g.39468 Transcript_14736/m.39468 type:complete len:222 (+) Transcript_14736:789-1454(+)